MGETSPEAIMADLLSSLLFHAHEGGRNYLYCWERDGLKWLRARKKRRPINDWTATFIEANGPALDENAPINWRLRDWKGAA